MLQKKRTPAGLLKAATIVPLMIVGMLYIQSPKEAVANVATPNPGSTKDAAGVYTSVDKLPEFIGQRYLHDYMRMNLRYPDEAKTQKIEGRVEVKFIIDEQGNLSNPTVISSPDELLSSEVLRVVSTMKEWSPAEVNGKKVRAYFTLPVEFKMEQPAPQPYDEALRKQMLIGNGRKELIVTANGC